MLTVAIKLTDDHERFIREAVNGGYFASQNEVVAMAIEILRRRETARRARRAGLKREIEKGVADFENGRTVAFSLDAFLAEMKAKRAATLFRRGAETSTRGACDPQCTIPNARRSKLREGP